MRVIFGWLLIILGGLLYGMCVLWAGLGLFVVWFSPARDVTDWKQIVTIWLAGFLGGILAAGVLILSGTLLRRETKPAWSGEVGGTRKVPGKSLLLVPLLLALVLAGLVAYFGYRELAFDPAAPPPLFTADELGQWKLLFDGKTTDGWKIDGPARVQDGTLEIGGDQAATAQLLHECEPGDKLQFHFFHEGPGKHPQDVVLRITPIFLNPNDPHKGRWQQGPEAQLRWSGLTPSGGVRCWHEGSIHSSYKGNNFNLAINLKQRLGQQGGPHYDYGRQTEGCRYLVFFQTSPGNNLLLRNICVAKAPAAKAGP